MDLTLDQAHSIDCAECAQWDRLDHGPSPFLRSGFLRALEQTESIGAASGWQPIYLLVRGIAEGTGTAAPLSTGVDVTTIASDIAPEDSTGLLGGVVAFIKTHSFGEYIFDWGWARAAMRANIPYYPKLVVAAPHTPATGRRILLAPGLDPEVRRQVIDRLVHGVRGLAEAHDCSSIHWLFTSSEERACLAGYADHHPRTTYQFHWHNQGYAEFDGFLASLSSRRRKQIRKERKSVLDQLSSIEWVSGRDVDDELAEMLERHYRSTVDLHGARAYLRPGFCRAVAREMQDEFWVACAHLDGQRVATASFFQTQEALYGRYWGCDRELRFLHFELAYYSGIERCIDQGLQRFEAGAQGEHKLLRGFSPAETHSVHWIRHPGLADAVGRSLRGECELVEDEMRQLAAYGPYKKEKNCP